ncbi:MAG: phospholipase nuclease protein [Sphingomonas bacterium]|uniref:S1/P1 nuclease n=1 Tax=Sphingomonas bacterium TaxID=1895847 RepID=UPI0026077146|nr:S1/P1 nuclease [Sphingomonas bacterium]MDB5704265.1 phospholipase nuclease protein [Sphingomonas bacterium]
MKFSIAAAITALVVASAPAAAWNARGHMMVAAVAWSQMTPAARARATALLKLNPRYAEWTRGVANAERDEVAFVKAATWPDELRNMVCTQGTPSPCYRDDGYTPPDAGAGINTGYADLRLRKYWHFEDLGFSPDGTPINEPFAFNAETQIAAFDTALGDASLSDGAKSYDLAWLLHMVGDVHQPLHAVSRFTTTTPSGDSGGNAVKICLPGSGTCDEAHAKALHSFWDGAAGTNSSPQSAVDKAEHLQKTMFAAAVTDSAPGAWVAESFELARNVAYAAPVGPGKGPYRLTTQYVAIAGTTAEQRVTLGGARLARILNRRLN